jgi:bacterioferritin (cytochrome b1)
MTADPRLVELFSYYRDAELHGANLLMRLMRLMADDPDAQVKLTLHIAEEMNHAWLWTKRITDMGALPMNISDGYQSRIGLRTVPRKLVDLLAITVVVEERSVARYQQHAARSDVDPETRRVLEHAGKDEKWHVAWIKAKLNVLAKRDGLEARVNEMMGKYRAIDEAVVDTLQARETAAFASDKVERSAV